MSYEERAAKFYASASRVLPDRKVADLRDMLKTLELQASVVPLMELLRT